MLIQISSLLKQKFLSLQSNRLGFFYLLIIFLSVIMAPPLYSYGLSNGDLPYFYALSKSDLEDAEIIENLEHSAQYGNKAVRFQAALVLSELGLKDSGVEHGFKDLRIVSEVCISLLDDGFTESALLENLLESYYLQEDYESLITAVDKYETGNTINSSTKIEYYRFLAKLYEGNNSAAEYFREFLLGTPTSELILNAYGHLQELGINLPVSTTGLAEFKIQLFNGEYSSAGRSMSHLLNTQKDTIIDTLAREYIVDNVILTPVILDEMYRVANASGRSNELLASIEELLAIPSRSGYEPGEVYTYEFIAELYETAGYLKRGKGRFKAAADMFMAGLTFATGGEYERMLWYWYNSLVRYSPETAAGQIGLLVEKWTDPDYFSDVLSELATFFVQQGQWTVIQEILDIIQFSGPDESISKYAYLTARAGMESRININEEEITRLLTLSYENGFGIASGLYYRILAGNYLKIFDIRKLPWMFNSSVSRNPEPVHEGMEGSMDLVFGWLEYGQYPDAYNYLMNNPFSDFNLIRRAAYEMSESGYFADSIRLLNRYSLIDGFDLNISDLELIYPDAYSREILSISDKEELKWYIFTSLVREESHFQRAVVSSAGAVGLSQLMPATAADVAERLRVSNYNLKDPATNLSFGGWYLGNLNRRTDILSDALFAYNGGLTRVRRWREEYSDLPDDLFLEAIPFKETSHYGRKLLVSSVIYGYLYEGIFPNEIISLFYRN